MNSKWTLVILSIFISLPIMASKPTETFEDITLKFKLSYLTKEWVTFTESDFASAGSLFLAKPRTSSLENTQASLSVRVDESNLNDEKRYIEKWLKDYPKFGYDLNLSQQAQYGAFTGYEIELTSKKNEKKIRQFVTKIQDQKFLIFTCSSEKEKFDETIKHCQKILNSTEKTN